MLQLKYQIHFKGCKAKLALGDTEINIRIDSNDEIGKLAKHSTIWLIQ